MCATAGCRAAVTVPRQRSGCTHCRASPDRASGCLLPEALLSLPTPAGPSVSTSRRFTCQAGKDMPQFNNNGNAKKTWPAAAPTTDSAAAASARQLHSACVWCRHTAAGSACLRTLATRCGTGYACMNTPSALPVVPPVPQPCSAAAPGPACLHHRQPCSQEDPKVEGQKQQPPTC